MTNYAIRARIDGLLSIVAVCIDDARRDNMHDLPNLTRLDLRSVPRLVEDVVKLANELAERNAEAARGE